MALSCPRPGCTGDVVNGNCQECGIAVAETAEQAAVRLRQEAEAQAASLNSEEEGTGWFASPATLDGEESSRGAGAHRKPDEPPVPRATPQGPAHTPPPGFPAQPGQPRQGFPGQQPQPRQVGGYQPSPQAQPAGQGLQPQPSQPWGNQPQNWQPSGSQPQPGAGQPSQPTGGQAPTGARPPHHGQPQPTGHGQPQPTGSSQAQFGQPAGTGQPQPTGSSQPQFGQPAGSGQLQPPGTGQPQPTGSQPGQPHRAGQLQSGQPLPTGSGQPQFTGAGQPQPGQPAGSGQPPGSGQPQFTGPQPGQPYQAGQPQAVQPQPTGSQAGQPHRPEQPLFGQPQPTGSGQPSAGAGQPGGVPAAGLQPQPQPGPAQGPPPQTQGWARPTGGSALRDAQLGYAPRPSGSRPAPAMPWAQGVPVPNVAPRQPGVKPAAALAPDEPLPTSVLDETPITLSVEPPSAPPRHPDSPPPTRAAPGENPHTTGSSSFPSTGRRTSSRTSRGRLGAGLVDVPVVPVKDPASAVLDDPMVSENKRFCSNCGAEVGRASNGEKGETEGECAKCGTYFNFRPRLFSGDLVAGQYEVLGCLAYGGLGWIYLAKDHNVSDRWVVLKGMIDTGDPTSMASAVAERRFLAEVEHPNVVRIYNFVQHPDPKTGNLVGYIVMEYVGGQSLRQLALEHHREIGKAEPLPIGQVIAYGLEILPAIGYLHSIDMLYCDLKPDNVIQAGEQLKLIDLGAVRKVDDWDSPLFFTLGYSAPELPTEGASVASDIYTVGRTLAVLSIEFAGYTTRHKYTLPGPDEEPLFALFGSYHRVLKRATHKDPLRRFASAEDMADQLTGVLREVMALGTNRPRPGTSNVFAMETRTFGSGMVIGERGSLPSPDPVEVASILPLPMVDTHDHAASALASITATEPAELVAALQSAPQDSLEVRLRMVRARLELGELRAAHGELETARRVATDPADWRPDWYQGLIAIATRNPKAAMEAFERVYDAVPGEIPPKLALAVAAEYAGNYFQAARYYELVWRTDRAWVSAAFGLARVYLAQGARTSAIEVLEAVPDTSSHHMAAQVAAIKIKTRADEASRVSEQDLQDASRKLERLTALDAERRTALSAEVLEAAHAWVHAGRPAASPDSANQMILGCRLVERDLRFGLEKCYRTLARLASTQERRHELVDKANAIRPRTLT